MDAVKTMREFSHRKQAERRRTAKIRKQSMQEKLGTTLPSLAEKYGFHTVYLFGSYAGGEPTERSDVDLYVEELESSRFWDLTRDLGTALNATVDIHTQDDDAEFIRLLKIGGIQIHGK